MQHYLGRLVVVRMMLRQVGGDGGGDDAWLLGQVGGGEDDA